MVELPLEEEDRAARHHRRHRPPHELGGVRGMDLYTNRTAIQGDRGLLKKILGA